jgi:hypothetical protein
LAGRGDRIVSILTYAKKVLRSFNQHGSMFLFGIPLMGSYLSDDFEGARKLLGQTPESCLRQTDGNFEIYVACKEIPDAGLVPFSRRIRYMLTKVLSISRPAPPIAIAAKPTPSRRKMIHAIISQCVWYKISGRPLPL